MNQVGKSVNRVDAVAKVSGKARYPGDIRFHDELCLKVLFAHRPHALVRAIDISRAKALPGVALVLTARDVPIGLTPTGCVLKATRWHWWWPKQRQLPGRRLV